MRAVFDTNILVDHLNGDRRATAEIARYRERFISVLTYIEVLVGTPGPEAERSARRFLSLLETVDTAGAVAELAVATRRETRLKLPDAIILATARHLHCPLVTRNTRDFGQFDEDVVVPYSV